MHHVDPAVVEKILGRPDRSQLEAELAKYPPAQQKRWVANPLLEWLLQSFHANLTKSAVHTPGSHAPGRSTAVSPVSPEAERKKERTATLKEDIKEDSDEEGGMFGLFD